jgi:hypothetical protein
VGQVNEALCKVLCRSIVVIAQSVRKLGVEATFWAESPLAEKVGV